MHYASKNYSFLLSLHLSQDVVVIPEVPGNFGDRSRGRGRDSAVTHGQC